MDSNEASRSSWPRGHAAWATSIAALLLIAGGGWFLSRSVGASRLDTPAPAPSTPATSGPQRAETESEAAAVRFRSALAPASRTAPPLSAQPPRSVAAGSLADALRKVQLTLLGPSTPTDMLEAATMLAACQGADLATESVYRQRDQPSPVWQQLQRDSGFSNGDQIRQQQDFQRRCQVFDAAALGRRGELLKGAYEGGAKDSALPYLQWLNETKQQVDPELRGKLQREARQTAEDGDFMALIQYSLAYNPNLLGTTEVQRQAYKEAMFRIQGELSGAAMEKAGRTAMDDSEKMMAKLGGLPPPLSPEQQQEASALAQKVLDAWRKRQGKGG